MKRVAQDNSITRHVISIRNSGVCGDTSKIVADIVDMSSHPAIPGFEQRVTMHHPRGLRTLLTNDIIMMETEWYAIPIGRNFQEEGIDWHWESGVYVYDCGEACLFPIDISGDTFRFIKTLDGVQRPTPAMRKTYAEAKSNAIAKWRLVFHSENDERFALVSDADARFDRRYPLREALLAIRDTVQPSATVYPHLVNPIPDELIPAEGVRGYLPGFLCHLLRSYAYVEKWGLGVEKHKRAHELLIELEGQIRDEMFKLKKAVDQEKEVESNLDVRLVETMIAGAVAIKQEMRAKQEIEQPDSMLLYQALEFVAQHCEVVISGLGKNDLVAAYFDTQGVNKHGVILSRKVMELEYPPVGVIPLDKLVEPGFRIRDNQSSTLVVRMKGNDDTHDKVIRLLRHVVVKWMHDSGKIPDLVIIRD